ncbi:hypothetical protein ACB094_03G032900 [Castanea mollissima]
MIIYCSTPTPTSLCFHSVGSVDLNFSFSVGLKIFNFDSVAGVAVIFEVQRSARSEAKKEEVRKQEVKGLDGGRGEENMAEIS